MSDFASTGNFRDVMSLARRAVVALESIASALDREPTRLDELGRPDPDPEVLADLRRSERDAEAFAAWRKLTAYERTTALGDLADRDRAVALAAKEQGGPMTEEEGAEFDRLYPSTPNPFCRECGRPLTSEPGDYCVDHVTIAPDATRCDGTTTTRTDGTVGRCTLATGHVGPCSFAGDILPRADQDATAFPSLEVGEVYNAYLRGTVRPKGGR